MTAILFQGQGRSRTANHPSSMEPGQRFDFAKANVELVAEKKKQLIPFQDRHEYMREYYSRLHPHPNEEEEETELMRSIKEELAMEGRIYADYRGSKKGAFMNSRFETKSKQPASTTDQYSHSSIPFFLPLICMLDLLAAATLSPMHFSPN